VQEFDFDAITGAFQACSRHVCTPAEVGFEEVGFEGEIRPLGRRSIDLRGTIRAAAMVTNSGFNGDNPPAIRSAWTK
jgi:hypothetical protein